MRRINKHDREAVGTGWVVAPDVLIANNDVVAGLCDIDVHDNPQQWRVQLNERLPAYNTTWAEQAEKRPVWDPGDSPRPGNTPVGVIRHVHSPTMT